LLHLFVFYLMLASYFELISKVISKDGPWGVFATRYLGLTRPHKIFEPHKGFYRPGPAVVLAISPLSLRWFGGIQPPSGGGGRYK
jgi:hypothetical protein